MNKTITRYIVITPIHGYNGMGYELKRVLSKKFYSEKAARKWAKHCNFAYQTCLKQLYFGCLERRENYLRQMTDNFSYSIRKESKVYKVEETRQLI